MNTCPYFCNNKTEFGYCKTTACINPMYNQYSITKWLEKADYVQVVRCRECKWWNPHGKETPASIPALGECQFKDRKFGTACWEFCFWGERKDDEYI